MTDADKPTIEQTAWVLSHVANHLRDGGTYRWLIYERMGYGKEAYVPLMDDGMYISNFGCEAAEKGVK